MFRLTTGHHQTVRWKVERQNSTTAFVTQGWEFCPRRNSP